MRSEFSLSKKRPGAYFCDDEGRTSVQFAGDPKTEKADPVLLLAVKAAKKEFFRVYSLEEQKRKTRGAM